MIRSATNSDGSQVYQLIAQLQQFAGVDVVQSTALAAEETRAMYLAFFDAIIDLSFIVIPLIVGFAAGFGESLPFLVCAVFLAGAGVLFQLRGVRE